jgi:transposase-like protein
MPNEGKEQLLTPQERVICRQMATREAPHGQRAAALIALDEGATWAKASEQAGLSKGQLGYWLTKFRQQRLNIFPDDLLNAVQSAPTSAEPVKEETAGVQPIAGVVKAKKTKSGKGKSGKKAKKKTKKAKGAKKGKKKKKKSPKKAEKKSKKAKGKKAKRV